MPGRCAGVAPLPLLGDDRPPLARAWLRRDHPRLLGCMPGRVHLGRVQRDNLGARVVIGWIGGHDGFPPSGETRLRRLALLRVGPPRPGAYSGLWPLLSASTAVRTFVACARVSENRPASWLADSGFPAAAVARMHASAAATRSDGTATEPAAWW